MRKIVIAYQLKIMCWSLRALLEQHPGVNVVGEAANIQDCMAIVEQTKPDVLIISASLLNGTPLELVSKLNELARTTRVLAVSSRNDDEKSSSVSADIADAWVLDTDTVENILQAVTSLINVQSSSANGLSRKKLSEPAPSLTKREHEVMRLAAEGNNIPKIADILSISSRTVEAHKSRMMRKLELKTQTELVRYAIRKGISSVD